MLYVETVEGVSSVGLHNELPIAARAENADACLRKLSVPIIKYNSVFNACKRYFCTCTLAVY